jgi:hypothetical protein
MKIRSKFKNKTDLIMFKKESKKCTVCDYLNGFSNESIKQKLNNLIYQEIKYNEFVDECRAINISNSTKNIINIPSQHFIKKHNNNCLVDFTPDIKETSNKFNKADEKDITLEMSEPDIDIVDFNNKTLVEKDLIYQKILHRIYYKQLLIVDNKTNKETVSTLKILNDLISINNIDIREITNINDIDNIKDNSDIEKIGLKLINIVISKGLLSLNTTMDIAKLFIKNGSDIDFFNKYVEPEMTPEEKEKRYEQIKEFSGYKNFKEKIPLITSDNPNETNIRYSIDNMFNNLEKEILYKYLKNEIEN